MRRCGRARFRGEEAGFSLVETTVALTLFLIVAMSLESVLVASVAGYSVAHDRTIAQQLANEEIEVIRALPYEQIGTIGGNPPGIVAASRTVTADGLAFTLRTRISYVDDPVPGSFTTAANYKRILVAVSRMESRELARQESQVAPAQRPVYGGANKAIIRTTIVDYALNAAVPDATVALETGPSAPRSDTTDTAGLVVFAALTATGSSEHYDVRVTKPGYVTLREDVPPGSAARLQVAPGQNMDTTLRIYLPATIEVRLTDALGLPYAGIAIITIASSRGSQEFSVAGGQLIVTELNGEPVVPGLEYTVGARALDTLYAAALTQTVPTGYPSVLGSLFTLSLQSAVTAKLQVTVRDGTTSNPVAGARVDVTDGPSSIVLTGSTNSGGVAEFNVPIGITPYRVRAQDVATGYVGEATASVPGPGATVVSTDLYADPGEN